MLEGQYPDYFIISVVRLQNRKIAEFRSHGTGKPK